ncbi:hypothetical protein QBC41DRAFT_17168 [Cercophora samala]|uniref:Uncharacterized protein n=1 Tax=Cercophora samala TaxID=330535 RepID=A0AA40D8N9_9PEZI|nr:hypothetical protein QBC41DRAFT_17168 [Cercophora samala]
MRLPLREHQQPVQGRSHQERRQLQSYPYPGAGYRDNFEPVTRTPQEIDDAISRSAPLSPAAPRLRVAEPSLEAFPSLTRPLSTMLIPSPTPVPSTLIVSTLTASSILTLAPSPSSTVLVNEVNQTEIDTTSPWFTHQDPGKQFVIWTIAAAMPATLIFIMLKDMFRPWYARYCARKEAEKREKINKNAEARAAALAAEEAEANEKDDDDNDKGDAANAAKKSSSTDATIVAKNTPPVSPVNPSPAVLGAPGSSRTGGGSSDTENRPKSRSMLDADPNQVKPHTAAANGNAARKIIFDDQDRITPAGPSAYTTAAQAAEATARSISLQQSTPRSLTYPVVKSCCKPKEALTTTPTASVLSTTAGFVPINTTPSYATNSASSYTGSGDRPLSKISEETESSIVTGSSVESLNTAMRQNVRLHSLISGSDDTAAAAAGDDDRRPGSNSSSSTVKAVGTAH